MYSMTNLDDGGDKNPPQQILEKSHKLQVKRKRTKGNTLKIMRVVVKRGRMQREF
jgi:hypothetical protein